MKGLKQSTIVTFWALAGVFLVVLCQFFIPAFRDLFMGSKLFLIPMAVFLSIRIGFVDFKLERESKRQVKKVFNINRSFRRWAFCFCCIAQRLLRLKYNNRRNLHPKLFDGGFARSILLIKKNKKKQESTLFLDKNFSPSQ